MNQDLNDKTAKRSLNIMNIFLLSVHICLLIFFAVLHVRLMAYVNIVSVLVYAGSFLLLKKEKITVYVFSTFIEIIVHMFLAVFSVGWDFGFQLY